MATTLSATQMESFNEIALIDFRIFEERDGQHYEGIYGINVAKVQSVMERPKEIFDAPGSPDYVLGLFDLRGVIIPVVDLSKWLNIKPTEQIPSNWCLSCQNSARNSPAFASPLQKCQKIIIAEFNNIQIGFIVDAVKLIRRINWRNVEPAHFSISSTAERGRVTGTTRIDDGYTMLILDLESIIDELDFYERKADDIIEIMEDQEKFSGIALVLDDSSVARKRVVQNLKAMGFDIIEAIDGEEGRAKMELLFRQYGTNLQEHLKIIVSDIEMPKVDGFQFANMMKGDARFAKIPIVFNSSICDQNTMEKGNIVGADGYIVKFEPELFYEEIKKILSSK
ncbi:chemotaxis protein CheW [Helicobacter sp. T3_23-1056]